MRLQFSATNSSITAHPSGNYADTVSLGNVTVLGVPGQVSNVRLNGQTVNSGWSYNGDTQALTVTGLNNLTSSGTWNSAWTLSWSVGANSKASSSISSSSSSAGSRVSALSAFSLLVVLVSALVLWYTLCLQSSKIFSSTLVLPCKKSLYKYYAWNES